MAHPTQYKFRLYVAGDTLNSAQAIANLGSLCRSVLPGQHEVEVVDVLSKPNTALEDGVMMTPMLIKLAPAPIRKIVGTLSQTGPLMHALGLKAAEA